MISAVDFVSVNVADQERAKRFYTDVLGMQLLLDVPMGEPDGAQWVEVRPPGSVPKPILFHAPDAVGGTTPFVFDTDDIRSTCADVVTRGVRIVDEPAIAPWGSWWALIEDSEGNATGLSQAVGDE